MYFLYFLLAWLILPILGVWPLVFMSDTQWSNNQLNIYMRPKEKVGFDTYLCAYAEEVTEWYLKALVFGLLCLPLALLWAQEDLLLNVAVFMVFNLLPLLNKIPVVERLIEYVGKSANIAVKPRDPTGSAKRLLNYYKCFAGMEVKDISKNITRAGPIGKFFTMILKFNIKRRTV